MGRLKGPRARAAAALRVLRDVRRGLSFAGAVLDRPLSVETALEAVRGRLERRASGFLATVDRTIFSYPASPYRPLLEAAGYDLGRIRAMVHERGVEATLERLRDEGVYISIEEFKGLREVRRKDRVFRFTDGDFSNPLISSGLAASSGGTRTVSITSVISSVNLRTGAEHLALALAAYGLERRPMIVWLPQSHGASHWAVLAVAMLGRAPVHWFSQLPDQRRFSSPRVNRTAIQARGYTLGKLIPSPRYVPFGQESAILRAVKDTGPGGCGILTTPSSALRLALGAQREGARLDGATFITIGEPLTPAKLSAIQRVGARAFSSLGFTEFGRASYGCPLAGDSDDTHLCRDAVAVVQRRRPVDRFGGEVQALLFTSLLPDARRVLLNVETGDYAVATARRCGCLLESAGWTEHLEGIHSFEKLNAEGRRFFGSHIISLVEETLPGRFGGGPTDYQMVEQEDEDGFTRLYILVDPGLGALDEREVLACVEETLSTNHLIGSTVWKKAGTIRLRRASPILTQAGKLMPLHHLGQARSTVE
jgi:hypothetical protein